MHWGLRLPFGIADVSSRAGLMAVQCSPSSNEALLLVLVNSVIGVEAISLWSVKDCNNLDTRSVNIFTKVLAKRPAITFKPSRTKDTQERRMLRA